MRPSKTNTIVKAKCEYKKKLDEQGKDVRNKAILVANCYSQEDGFDYTKLYAFVASLEAIYILLSFVALVTLNFNNWMLKVHFKWIY